MVESTTAVQPLAFAPLRYGLAVVTVAAALIITGRLERLLVTPPLERFVDAVSLLYAAVVLSAWLGGIGPGVLAGFLAVLAIDYFYTPPLHAVVLDLVYLPRIAIFALSGLLIGWLNIRRTRAEDALKRSYDELEVRVQERTADLTRSNQQLHTEIAARKRAEEMLRERAELLDLTHDTVFVRDMNDVITYWNRGAEELYGWTRGEAVGKVSHDLTQTVFPAPLAEIMAQLIRTGRWDGELVHTRRDRTTVVVASRWSLSRDDDGRPVAILETNNDTTERKRAEQGLQKAQAELAHITRVMAVEELAASIAHEINQPLAAIVTNIGACVRWLARDPPNLDEARDALERVIRDGNRASEVIARVRMLVRKSAPERTLLDIKDVIGEVIRVVQGEAARQHVSLRTSLADDVPPVLGDRIQLQQVLLNLVVNGIEAMTAVTDRPRELMIRTQRDESGGVLVAVQDSGIGFDTQTMDRLFETFFRPSLMGWAWACRSAARSSRLTGGGCGLGRTPIEEPSSSSPCPKGVRVDSDGAAPVRPVSELIQVLRGAALEAPAPSATPTE
jgi:two-component system, LuxR family, sensor kinase FixL